jgi:hypothetical protein
MIDDDDDWDDEEDDLDDDLDWDDSDEDDLEDELDEDDLDDGEDEIEDAEEDDRGPGWYEDHFGGPEEEDSEEWQAQRQEEDSSEEASEHKHGGGIVTNVPLAQPTTHQAYENLCWQCREVVDDSSMPRCSTGCGWVRCRCGACLCDMPLAKRLERPYTVMIGFIDGAVRLCSTCGGVCFVPGGEPGGAGAQQVGTLYYTPCALCGGRGFLTE